MRGGMGAPAKLLAAVQVVAAAASAATQGFGPGNCVTVTLSDKGSCQLHTNCLGQDISEFDFSFDCVPLEGGPATTHSLGIGSFDDVEDYDSEVQCNQCWPPSAKPTAAVAKAVVKPAADLASGVAAAVKGAVGAAQIKPDAPKAVPKVAKAPSTTPAPAVEAPAKQAQLQFKAKIEAHVAAKVNIGAPLGVGAESYGPKMCVSTWRNASTGHCMMQTDCVMNEDISTYEFGLLCEEDQDDDEEEKKLVRHLFGVGTFKRRETFDTLIKCKQCRALDDPPLNGNNMVKALGEQVAELQAQLRRVSKDVVRLDEHVFPEAPMAAPAASPMAVMAGSPMAAPSAGPPVPRGIMPGAPSAAPPSLSPSPSLPTLAFAKGVEAPLHSVALKKAPAPEGVAKPDMPTLPPTQAFVKKVEVKDKQAKKVEVKDKQATLHSVPLRKGPAPEPAQAKAQPKAALASSNATKANAAPVRLAAKPAAPVAAAPKPEAKDNLIRRGALRGPEAAVLKAQKEASALKAQQKELAKQISRAQAVVLSAGKRQQQRQLHQGQQQLRQGKRQRRQEKAEDGEDEEEREDEEEEDEEKDREEDTEREAEDDNEEEQEDDEERE